MYTEAMIYELRTYEIPNNVRNAFHERFEQHALPLMKQHGITVIGCWDEVIGEMQNFCYIIQWKNLADREATWPKFNNDADWSRIKKESAAKHGEMVRKTHNRILSPTSYSPLS
jgi:hypothetical protein